MPNKSFEFGKHIRIQATSGIIKRTCLPLCGVDSSSYCRNERKGLEDFFSRIEFCKFAVQKNKGKI